MRRPEKNKPQPPPPLSDAELAEVERGTVQLAEIEAGVLGVAAERVLARAFDQAAVSGATPFELLKNRRRRTNDGR